MIKVIIRFFLLIQLLALPLTGAAVESTGQQAASADPVDYWLYTVVSGDNWSKLVKKYCQPETSIKSLADFNSLKNLNLLQPGQELKIPKSALKADLAPIKIMVLSGDVTIKKKGAKRFVKLNASDEVVEGDAIKTGDKSIAKLRFANGSVANLQPRSSVLIETSRQIVQSKTYNIKLKLKQGRAEVNANPDHHKGDRFQVETPSAVAVVRGTTFRVAADGDVGIEETLGGAVSFVANEKEVLVESGYGSLAEKGKAPLPPQILPSKPSTSDFATKFDYLPIAFDLHEQPDAEVVLAQVAKDHAFEQLIAEQSIKLSDGQLQHIKLNELKNGQYYLKLRAKDAHGLQGEDAIHSFYINVYPLPPVQLFNKNTFIGKQLYWSAISGSNGYVVQVANDEHFDNILLEDSVSYNAFYLTGVLADSDAYWRVAIKGNGRPYKFSKPKLLKLH